MPTKKCEKCGTCSKAAADDSVQCEICEQWFHNKCQDISDLLYKALNQFGSEIHRDAPDSNLYYPAGTG